MNVLTLAAVFLGLSGLFHLPAIFYTGLHLDGLVMVAFGIVYLILAKLLRSGSRGLSWLVFIMMLVFPIVALSTTGSGSPIPDSLIYLLVLLDWACALCLFVVLWRNPIKTTV